MYVAVVRYILRICICFLCCPSKSNCQKSIVLDLQALLHEIRPMQFEPIKASSVRLGRIGRQCRTKQSFPFPMTFKQQNETNTVHTYLLQQKCNQHWCLNPNHLFPLLFFFLIFAYLHTLHEGLLCPVVLLLTKQDTLSL